ncbi:DUF4870 domain-containing protein [Natrarchaeobius chitinivorans]|uniref:DUF4870 domain-containing protein n=1 Tax=Natrarchaeobius chitinivorans TaxID=1679083 RepID=A0A3N6MKM5_NATCH|nr:DUF4870 domain-containing protein [Natrarchaeobius chitinivorans]RQG97790.1 DUF4870 domain-containing protein [Natrarchaeobius chitinivorans]
MATKSASSVESAASTETSLGPDGNVIAMLSYFFAPIGGLLVYLLEEDNGFARYHAAQSIVFGLTVIVIYAVFWIGMLVLGMLMGSVPVIGFLLEMLVALFDILISLALWLAVFLVWLYLVVKAYQGEAASLPIISSLAQKHLL